MRLGFERAQAEVSTSRRRTTVTREAMVRICGLFALAGTGMSLFPDSDFQPFLEAVVTV
jgi:hypothetical protein